MSILQVTAGWDEGLRAKGAAAQAAALQRLAVALDQLARVDLAGVHIMLGAASGIDHLGQARLRTTDSTEEWVRCAPAESVAHVGAHMCSHPIAVWLDCSLAQRFSKQTLGAPAVKYSNVLASLAICHELHLR